jgi:cytochrome c oxidase cbb3-type subunit IV
VTRPLSQNALLSKERAMTTGDVSTYEAWREFAATWGSAYFGLIFFAALVYALRPSRRKHFDDAAQIPLRED